MDEVTRLENSHRELLLELRALIQRTLKDGITPDKLASALLEMSKEAAMEGDVVEIYRHTERMQARGAELQAQCATEFGDLIDLEALARGEIKALV